MKIVVAEGELLETILDHTFTIWNEGLSRTAYAQWNAGQRRTPWGRTRLQRFALLDDQGQLLSTLKRYRYDVRIGERHGWMSGLGAIFTPQDRRGNGHALGLMEHVLEMDRRDGALMAGLFSEIGASYYRRAGFEPVPFREATVKVARGAGAPAMLVRAGADDDVPAIAEMHKSRSRTALFALRRDLDTTRFALTKKRMFAGLSPPGRRQFEFFVAEEGASPVAYVVLSVNANGWTLEDAGDRDPAGARLGAMLQVLIAREPSRSMPLIRTWWPMVFPIPPQIELTDFTDPRDLFMVRALANVEVPSRPEDVFYWRIDTF